MKKSLKKVLAVILSAIMLVSCSAVSVFAQGSSAIGTAVTAVKYADSVKTLVEQGIDFQQNLPKRLLNVGVSAFKLGKAKSDNTQATVSGLAKLGIANVQLAIAVGENVKSRSDLNNDILKLGFKGLQIQNSISDLNPLKPSLSDLYHDVLLIYHSIVAVVNVVDIVKGDEDENAKPLTGTALITENLDEEQISVEAAETPSEDEETPAPTAVSQNARVANTDGPMD